MVSSLVSEEDFGASSRNKGTGISTLRRGNCSGGGVTGREGLEGTSWDGRAEGGGITTVIVVDPRASGVGARVLPGADREMFNAGLKTQKEMLGSFAADKG
jgi:hypothetical protein